MDSLSARLVRRIRETPITAADREKAALFVLDLVGCALGAKTSDAGGRVLDWVARIPSPDTGRQAFVFAALSHTLEVDDLHRASVVHPGCVVIPAAWAVARRQGAKGADFLDAVVRGYEAACRIGMSVGPKHYDVWHNTATCGPFGAAFAAGSLLGLDETAMVNALGNAGTQSSGFWQFLPDGAMSKHLHAGHAVEAGILAADLAAHGFTGPAHILEGDQGFYRAMCPDPAPEALSQAWQNGWQVHLTSMKPWPGCRHTHPAIDAAQALRPHFKPDQIERVDVATYKVALDVCNRPNPTTDYDAKFSLQHAVAAALSEDEVRFDSFEAGAREAFDKLRNKVDLSLSPSHQEGYPNAWGCTVTVTTKEDETRAVTRHIAKGDPEAGLSVEDVRAKAAGLFEMGGIEQSDDLANRILALTADAPLPDLPLPGLSGGS